MSARQAGGFLLFAAALAAAWEAFRRTMEAQGARSSQRTSEGPVRVPEGTGSILRDLGIDLDFGSGFGVELGGELGPVHEPPPATVPAGFTARDLDLLARTIWGEARGQPRAGQEAVANVIMNRVRSRRYPSTPAAVVLQRAQFSAWNAGNPNRAKMEAVTDADPQFRLALDIARRALEGTLAQHVSADTLHYVNPRVSWPSWAQTASGALDIGDHRFLAGVA